MLRHDGGTQPIRLTTAIELVASSVQELQGKTELDRSDKCDQAHEDESTDLDITIAGDVNLQGIEVGIFQLPREALDSFLDPEHPFQRQGVA